MKTRLYFTIGFLLFILFLLIDSIIREEIRVREIAHEHIRCLDGPKRLKVPLVTRNKFGFLLEELKFETAIQVGVQNGNFPLSLLLIWKSCKEMHLVDERRAQGSYFQASDVKLFKDNRQLRLLQRKWRNKTRIHKNSTALEGAAFFLEESVDFIYLDARHDYCAVKEDLQLYWGKLKKGGIIGGGGYFTSEISTTSCADGLVHTGGVKRAVNEFAFSRNLHLQTTYKDRPLRSWYFQKPCGAPPYSGNITLSWAYSHLRLFSKS